MDTNPGTPLPADTGGNTAPDESSCSSGDRVPDEPVPPGLPDVPSSMTLEQIIDMTGEFVHLNELIMLHIESAGGFAGADAYFRTVQPLLDLLEVEIRVRCRTGITQREMKRIVHDWIDEEIGSCRNPGSG